MLLGERLPLQYEAGELIEGDRHQPYLDGGLTPINRGADPAGSVPRQSVRSSPGITVLFGIPLGQLFGACGRRRHPDDLRLGC